MDKKSDACPRDVSHPFSAHIRVPIELLEKILRCGWFSPRFSSERIAFINSVALVSKTWLEALLRIICRDVYIPLTPHYLADERQIIVGWSPFFDKFLPDVYPTQLCRTITRQIPVSGKTTRHDFQGKSTQNMLSTFRGLSFMPNLRTLSVEYYNPAFGRNHIFSYHASIIQCHLEYIFGSDFPRWVMEALLASGHSTSKHLPWALPKLEHISTPVNEDPTTSIVKVLDHCPHLRLADERFTIRVNILSSSRHVPDDCIIFHGVMPSFDAGIMDFGPKTVRGSALVLVFMKEDDMVCESSIDLSNTSRNVQVFVHKNQ
jgi:hypothetical protein